MQPSLFLVNIVFLLASFVVFVPFLRLRVPETVTVLWILSVVLNHFFKLTLLLLFILYFSSYFADLCCHAGSAQ